MANCKADLRCYRVRLNTVPESAFVEAGLFVKSEYSISHTGKYICFWNDGEDLPHSFIDHEITLLPVFISKIDNLTRQEAADLTQTEAENDLESEGWLKKSEVS